MGLKVKKMQSQDVNYVFYLIFGHLERSTAYEDIFFQEGLGFLLYTYKESFFKKEFCNIIL